MSCSDCGVPTEADHCHSRQYLRFHHSVSEAAPRSASLRICLFLMEAASKEQIQPRIQRNRIGIEQHPVQSSDGRGTKIKEQ